MAPVLLAALALTLPQDVRRVEGPGPRVTYTLELAPDGPALEPLGPIGVVEHTVEHDGWLIAWARSEVLDPWLVVADGEGQPLIEDDDSGGGTTAFDQREVRAGDTFTIAVASARPGVGGEVQLVLLNAFETEATRAAFDAGLEVFVRARGRVEQGWPGGWTEEMTETVRRLLTMEGAELSLDITGLLFGLAPYLDALDQPLLETDVRRRSIELSEGLLPPDHDDLWMPRSTLSVHLFEQGELEEARALGERVLEACLRLRPAGHRDIQRSRIRLAAVLQAQGELAAARDALRLAYQALVRRGVTTDADLLACTHNLALVLRQLGDSEGAEALFREVHDVREGFVLQLVSTKRELGETLRDAGKLGEALVHHEAALGLVAPLFDGDHPEVLACEEQLGITLYKAGDWRRAEELFDHVLDVRDRTLDAGDPARLDALFNKAVLLGFQGRWYEARGRIEEILSHRARSSPEDDDELLRARQLLADNRFERGDLEGALELHRAVFEIRDRTLREDHPARLTSMSNMALVLCDLGDTAGARELQEEVLRVLRTSLPEDDHRVVDAVINLAATLRDAEEYGEARAMFEGVAELLSAQPLPPGDLRPLTVRHNYANVLRESGDIDGAVEHFRRALAESAALGEDHPVSLTVRLSLAATLALADELDEALVLAADVYAYHDGTLPTWHPRRLRAMTVLSVILLEQGANDEARRLLEDTFDRDDAAPDPRNRILLTTKTVLVEILLALGDRQAAREMVEEILEARVYAVSEATHPVGLETLGGVLVQCGELERAKALYESRLAAHASVHAEDHPYVLDVRHNLGYAHMLLGELDLAGEHARFVHEVRSATLAPGHPRRVAAAHNLAYVLARLGELDEAIALLDPLLADDPTAPEDGPKTPLLAALIRLELGHRAEGLALLGRFAREVRSIIGEVALEVSTREAEDRAASLAQLVSHALSIVAQLEPGDGRRAAVRDALALVESLRGAGLVGPRLFAGVEEDERSAELRTEIRRATVALRNRSTGSVADVAQYSRARRARDAALAELYRYRVAKLGPTAPLLQPTADALVARLAPGEAMVGYWQYERSPTALAGELRGAVDGLLAFVVGPGEEVRLVDLGPAAEIEDAVRDWRRSLGTLSGSAAAAAAPGGGSRELGERLRRLVLEPVLAAAGSVRRLTVAPDGVLHEVPFDALPMRDGFVGDRVEVRTLSTLWETLLEPRATDGADALVAVGGVDYRPLPSLDVDPRGSGRLAGVMDATAPRAEYAPLPSTLHEVQHLGALWAGRVGAPVHLLTGAAATAEALGELAPLARILHLATHGDFDPRAVPAGRAPQPIDRGLALGTHTPHRERVRRSSPMLLSGLALAGANGSGRRGARPGFLTAEEVSTLDLGGCELVVLSVCEGKVGVATSGQGVASLQKAFHMAGARQVLGSLWEVDDRWTRELVTELYTEVFERGTPLSAALWRAKRSLRERGAPTRDWAGWVLTGAAD